MYFIGDRGSDKKPGVGQTTGGVSKPACWESCCSSSSKRRAIPRGVHEMRERNRNCEQVYLWVVTPPSHLSFGEDPSHQSIDRPNGQTVPRFGCLDG